MWVLDGWVNEWVGEGILVELGTILGCSCRSVVYSGDSFGVVLVNFLFVNVHCSSNSNNITIFIYFHICLPPPTVSSIRSSWGGEQMILSFVMFLPWGSSWVRSIAMRRWCTSTLACTWTHTRLAWPGLFWFVVSSGFRLSYTHSLRLASYSRTRQQQRRRRCGHNILFPQTYDLTHPHPHWLTGSMCQVPSKCLCVFVWVHSQSISVNWIRSACEI